MAGCNSKGRNDRPRCHPQVEGISFDIEVMITS